MKILDTTFRTNAPEVRVTCSLLHEAAIGIAAVTNKSIHDTLDHANLYWKDHMPFSKELQQELDKAERNNTWKIVLDLVQESNFEGLNEYDSFIRSLAEDELRIYALPYLGSKLEKTCKRAVEGDSNAFKLLNDSIKDHDFFPSIVNYIFETPIEDLRNHITNLLNLWHEEVVVPHEKEISEIIKRDVESKRRISQRLTDEEFVQWVLDYKDFEPDPTVSEILLIPHITYRPWVIYSVRKGRQIFYYPVDDESLLEKLDPYQPPFKLVQRFKALGDDNRLKILKILSEREMSLKELTATLGLGKTTVHHHLTLLRSARLVKMSNSKYSLQKHLLGIESKQLMSFLNVDQGEE